MAAQAEEDGYEYVATKKTLSLSNDRNLTD